MRFQSLSFVYSYGVRQTLIQRKEMQIFNVLREIDYMMRGYLNEQCRFLSAHTVELIMYSALLCIVLFCTMEYIFQTDLSFYLYCLKL